ncbi:hypothetical protein BCD48_43640 [Pseudofrankia sp. BMG5.36]|nr:hypothetical protein BCD48_43640 [Pseudofrankia sp. BMG5.36]
METRRRVGSFLLGLVAGLARTNCWTLAEHADEATPDGMQRLLGRAVWDADAVREDLRDHVVERLGQSDAVLDRSCVILMKSSALTSTLAADRIRSTGYRY